MKRILCIALCGITLLTTAFAASSCRKLPDEEQPSDTAEQQESKLPEYANDLSPYITIGQYKGVQIPKHTVAVTEAQIAEQLDLIAASHAESELITTRGAADGDTLTADCTATVGSDRPEDLCFTAKVFTLGKSEIPVSGFDEKLIGAHIGETASFDLTLPSDYEDGALAGKTCHFSVTVKKVVHITLPPIDDALAEKAGFDTLADMRAAVSEQIADAQEAEYRKTAIDDAWQAVLGNCEVLSYPEDAVTFYYDEMYNSYVSYAEYCGKDLETFLADYAKIDLNTFRQQCLDSAHGAVREDMILLSISRAEGIALTDAEYQIGLQEYCTKYQMSQDELIGLYTEERLRRSMLWEKVWAFLADNAEYVTPQS